MIEEERISTTDLRPRIGALLSRLYGVGPDGEINPPIDDDGFLPEDLEKELQAVYDELVKAGLITFEIYEGLDGAGKATQVELRTRAYLQCGYNVLNTAFPQYDTSSGQIIKGFLTGDHLMPDKQAYDVAYIKLKMNWYAINRLDTIRAIQIDALRLFYENNRPVKVICDRSHLANIATLAYSWKAADENNLPENWQEQIEYYLKHMFWIDVDFIEMLGIPEDVDVVFPVLPAQMIEGFIEADTTREVIDRRKVDIGPPDGVERRKPVRTDINENSVVQGYMLEIIRYLCDEKLLPNLHFISQVDESGKRLSAQEVYDIILSEIGIEEVENNEELNVGTGCFTGRRLKVKLKFDQIIPRSYRKRLMELMNPGLESGSY